MQWPELFVTYKNQNKCTNSTLFQTNGWFPVTIYTYLLSMRQKTTYKVGNSPACTKRGNSKMVETELRTRNDCATSIGCELELTFVMSPSPSENRDTICQTTFPVVGRGLDTSLQNLKTAMEINLFISYIFQSDASHRRGTYHTNCEL